jgi:D-inositol-3-phosphate glycosyltransferase
VVHVPAGPEVPLPKEDLYRYLPLFVSGIKHFAREKGLQYDVIHSHYWLSGLAAMDLSKIWEEIPIVHMFHTLGQMKNRVARTPAEVEGGYRIEGEKQVIQGVDRIIAATLAEKAQLQFLYGADQHKITVLPPGVDTSRFYPIPADEAKAVVGIPPEDNLLLFVGRIEPLKGVDTLLRAIALIRNQGLMSCCPHYLAIIGGDPDANPEEMTAEMSRLQDLSRELGVGDVVIFLGKRGQDSLPYYYSAAQVVIMPSHYESFGMVALEAMACGKPVVASQVGGLAFLVQDGVTGYHVPDGDPQALCAKLSLLMHDEETRERMGKQAANYAREYGWDKIAPRLLEVYQSTLEQN